jgi:hypothetical protein
VYVCKNQGNEELFEQKKKEEEEEEERDEGLGLHVEGEEK